MRKAAFAVLAITLLYGGCTSSDSDGPGKPAVSLECPDAAAPEGAGLASVVAGSGRMVGVFPAQTVADVARLGTEGAAAPGAAWWRDPAEVARRYMASVGIADATVEVVERKTAVNARVASRFAGGELFLTVTDWGNETSPVFVVERMESELLASGGNGFGVSGDGPAAEATLRYTPSAAGELHVRASLPNSATPFFDKRVGLDVPGREHELDTAVPLSVRCGYVVEATFTADDGRRAVLADALGDEAHYTATIERLTADGRYPPPATATAKPVGPDEMNKVIERQRQTTTTAR